MDFLDRTGHIFSLQSYSSYPVGYEYQETPYIFWFNSEKSYKLSTDCWYFQPIRIVIPVEVGDTINLKASLESDKFSLLGYKDIQDKLLSDEFKDINDRITLYSNTFKKELVYNATIKLVDGELKIDEDRENIDFLGCLVERSTRKTYIKYYYTYNNGANIYDGIPEEKYGVLFGKLKIGPLEKEVELDPITSKEVYLNNEEIHDGEVYSGFYLRDGELLHKSSPVNSQTTYYLILPFYCLAKSSDIGSWETNILIQYGFEDSFEDEFCPITVGAEFTGEVEPLIINGKNMGVSLPKEILKAVYSGNYFSNTVDENLYSQKLKEFLLNYMNIRGERGNYKSVINSLKWFEWGGLLTINKLWKRDVDIQNQYLRDYFDIVNDTIYSYQLFINTTLISLSFKLNEETFDEEGNLLKETQDFQNYFAGEGKPILEEKLSKLKERRYDEEDIPFYRGYYDYTFTELGLKLCALKYYYEKYFLPIHIKIHSASLSHQVWMNDIKFFARTNNYITEVPVYNGYYNSLLNYDTNIIEESKDIRVVFNYPNAVNNDVIYINHIIDTLDIEKDKNQIQLNYENYLSKYPDTDYDTYIQDKENLKDFYYFDEDYNCFSNTKVLALTDSYINNKEYLPITISIINNEVIIDNDTDNLVSVRGESIIISNTGKKRIKYILSGNFNNFYFDITSNTEPYIVLDNTTFSNTTKTLINIRSTSNTYIELVGNNTLGKSATPIKKGISSKGDLIFFGNGQLSIFSNFGNCIDSDKDVRIYNFGTYNLNYTLPNNSRDDAKNCINSKGNVIIYAGNITCTVKGNCTSSTFKASSCIKGDRDFTIYGGVLNLTAQGNGDKCINFDGNANFLGGNIFTVSYGKVVQDINFTDTKSPKPINIGGNVIINSSEITSKSNILLDRNTGTEAFECEGDLILYKGKLFCHGNEDGLNIGGNLYLYGGTLIGLAENGDGIDINKTAYILGGVIIGITTSNISGDDGIDVEYETVEEDNYTPREHRYFIELGNNQMRHYGFLFDYKSSEEAYAGSPNEKYADTIHRNNPNRTVLNKVSEQDRDNILLPDTYYLVTNELISFIFVPNNNDEEGRFNEEFYKYVLSSSYETHIYNLGTEEINIPLDMLGTSYFSIVDDSFIQTLDLSNEILLLPEDTNYEESPIDEQVVIEEIDNLDKLNYSTSEEEIEDNIFTGYYVDDTALFIPISILCPSGQYLDIHLELYKEDNEEPIHYSDFKFIQSEDKRYKGLVIYPKLINKDFNINYWENKKFKLKLLINGNYFEYEFIAKIPELNIGIGKLIYEYNDEFKQLKSLSEDSIEFNSYMHEPNLITVNNLDWPEEIRKFQNSLTDYINKYYSGKVNTINKYLNYCYLIDIFDSNGDYISVSREENSEYSDIWEYINKINGYNDSLSLVQNIDLYNDFFTSEGEIKDDIAEKISKNLGINEVKSGYDFYLMHDFEKWYLICISKDTTENIDNPMIINSTFKSDNYNFRFLKADKKLLINRFKFIEEEGYNHFKEDDLLAFYLRCNDKLKFKVTFGTKWKINQISIKNPNSLTVESNSELAIVSLQNTSNKLNKGYYNISVFYSIDDYSQNTLEAKGKFMIE